MDEEQAGTVYDFIRGFMSMPMERKAFINGYIIWKRKQEMGMPVLIERTDVAQQDFTARLAESEGAQGPRSGRFSSHGRVN